MKDIADWVLRKCPELLPEISRGKDSDSPAIFWRLHPGAEEVQLILIDQEHVVVSASTSAVGPGYHIFLVSLLKDLARDFQTSWQRSEGESGECVTGRSSSSSGDKQR